MEDQSIQDKLSKFKQFEQELLKRMKKQKNKEKIKKYSEKF